MRPLTIKQENFCQQYVDCLDVEKASNDSGFELLNKPGDGYYVYLLVDPTDGHIFYVGKGIGNRAYTHEKLQTHDRNNVKKAAIIKIKKKGESVRHLFFSTGLKENDALSVEKQLIEKFRDFGLTNIQSGVVSTEDSIMAALTNLRDKIVLLATAKHTPSKDKLDSITRVFGSMDGYYTYMLTSIDWAIYGKPKNPEFKGSKAVLNGIIENAKIKNQEKSSLGEELSNV